MEPEYMVGAFTQACGACPSCDMPVPRTVAWNPDGARDIYVCHRCGTYEYGTKPLIPGLNAPTATPSDPFVLGWADDVAA